MLWWIFHLRFVNSTSFFVFFCFFMFHKVNGDLRCEPGNKLMMTGEKCVPCDKNQYRPQSGTFRECLNCRTCGQYMEKLSECTPTDNTKCRCLQGFALTKLHKQQCVCPIGSGLEKSGSKHICKKCEKGSFTSQPNSECRPWTKCDKSGERVPGSNISDVICKNATKVEVDIVTSSVNSPNTVAQTSANTSTVAWTTQVNHLAPTTPAHPSSKKHTLWLPPLLAILALLFIQLVILKMKPVRCFRKKKQHIIRRDSAVCRKPVEESGEKFLLPFV